MPGGRDRQELGQTLDHAHHGGFQQQHQIHKRSPKKLSELSSLNVAVWRSAILPVMPPSTIHETARLGAFAIAAVWLAVAALLYLVFERMEQNRQASLKPYALSSGDLVIPRQRDGHFHVEGEVNRQPVRFLVDTGASHVSVSQALATQAGLHAGQSITLHTANGQRPGQLVRSVPVRAGHLVLNDTSVTVGLSGLQPTQALLGQAFLKHFDVEIRRDEMVLRQRP
jgi:aspartyl protease family protein